MGRESGDRIKGCDGACVHAVGSLAGADGWSITNVAAFPFTPEEPLQILSEVLGVSPTGSRISAETVDKPVPADSGCRRRGALAGLHPQTGTCVFFYQLRYPLLFATMSPRERSTMANKKIDPLNKKAYGAVSAALTVADIPAAVTFYQKAFGFAKRGIMNGPDGKPVHAELTLRGTVLMLGPESPAMGRRTAKNVGASPAALYLYVENVDKVVEKATKLGATGQGPVMDMFWGDRVGSIIDPDGYIWMIGTHKAEPTAKEMKNGMKEMMKQQPASAAAAD